MSALTDFRRLLIACHDLSQEEIDQGLKAIVQATRQDVADQLQDARLDGSARPDAWKDAMHEAEDIARGDS